MAKRKFRRYEDGGEVDPLEAANQSQESQDIAKSITPGPKAEPEPPVKQTFKEAFAEARRGGGKTFEWNGKTYTTELAKPAATKAMAKPSAVEVASETERLKARVPASKYETPFDRMNRQNREASAARATAKETERETLRKNVAQKASGKINPRTLLPEPGMKKGGFVSKASSRADGIAQKGKTRGRII